eukprot:scaffold51248_cov68-Phaeocystis_antarctica.AAC.5
MKSGGNKLPWRHLISPADAPWGSRPRAVLSSLLLRPEVCCVFANPIAQHRAAAGAKYVALQLRQIRLKQLKIMVHDHRRSPSVLPPGARVVRCQRHITQPRAWRLLRAVRGKAAVVQPWCKGSVAMRHEHEADRAIILSGTWDADVCGSSKASVLRDSPVKRLGKAAVVCVLTAVRDDKEGSLVGPGAAAVELEIEPSRQPVRHNEKRAAVDRGRDHVVGVKTVEVHLDA